MDGIGDGIPEAGRRLVARTKNIEEANIIADQYELEGFKTEIVKKKQGGISVFEVWIWKKPDIFQRM